MSEHMPLSCVRVVEISAFVAAPLGGMTLAQLGAEVIRIDPLGGNIDAHRWPITNDGNSIYWPSLNKGKQSVTLNLKSENGQAVAKDIIREADVVLTNLPARGWLSYDALTEINEHLIMLRLTGDYDGSPAVDYTVNAASGFPFITGDGSSPINHALPAWDVIAGLYISTGIIGALFERERSGTGQEITVALSDTMLATVGNLGYIAEQQLTGGTRGALGNGLYGAYGQTFATRDNKYVMIVAISNRQWDAIGTATGLTERLDMIGPMMGVDLRTEGGRYKAREAIDAVLRPWFAENTAAEASAQLKAAGALQGVFQTFEELVTQDPRCSTANPLFTEIDQPGLGRVLAPGLPVAYGRSTLAGATPAPLLGSSTERVLRTVTQKTSEDIQLLRDQGVIDASN